MTSRWRTVLRVRALLQALFERHVPMGTLGELLERVSLYSDSELRFRYARGVPEAGPGALAVEAAWQIVSEEPFDPNEARRRDVQRVVDEVEVRRQDAQRAFEATADQGQNAVVGAFDQLLAFLALEQAGVPGEPPPPGDGTWHDLPSRELLGAARDVLRRMLQSLHGFGPRDATADAISLETVILQLDTALRKTPKGVDP